MRTCPFERGYSAPISFQRFCLGKFDRGESLTDDEYRYGVLAYEMESNVVVERIKGLMKIAKLNEI
jgi:hypothetical protein